MVCGSARDEQMTIAISQDAFDVWVEALLEIGFDELATALCGKDAMNSEFRK